MQTSQRDVSSVREIGAVVSHGVSTAAFRSSSSHFFPTYCCRFRKATVASLKMFRALTSCETKHEPPHLTPPPPIAPFADLGFETESVTDFHRDTSLFLASLLFCEDPPPPHIVDLTLRVTLRSHFRPSLFSHARSSFHIPENHPVRTFTGMPIYDLNLQYVIEVIFKPALC